MVKVMMVKETDFQQFAKRIRKLISEDSTQYPEKQFAISKRSRLMAEQG